jgi:hypothetical protein
MITGVGLGVGVGFRLRIGGTRLMIGGAVPIFAGVGVSLVIGGMSRGIGMRSGMTGPPGFGP